MLTREHKKQTGFTIVELLIVVVVIGILAGITVVAYNGIQVRSRDAKRAHDYSIIQKMLQSYTATSGGMPHVSTYGGSGGGGWNTSTMASWITPLESVGKVPKDPLNDFTGDPGNPANNAGYGYFYFCYDENPDYVRLGYYTEANNRERIATRIDGIDCKMS